MFIPTQRPGLLTVSLVPETPCLFLHLRGELDLSSEHQLPDDDHADRPDLTTVLVDLGDLTFCDCAGLRALVSFRQTHEARGRTVEVVRANPFVWRLMRLTGLTDRLQIAGAADTPARSCSS